MNENKNKKNSGCFIFAILFIGLFIGMFLCGGFTLLISFFSESNSYQEIVLQDGDYSGKVVIIDIKGEITNDISSSSLLSSGIASAPIINSQIQSAMDDPDVVGIIFDMNTPGGDVVASDMIYDKVKEAQSLGLYVITVMGTTAASGGYYIASASDEILANEMTITGSIGVYSVYQDVSGLYEKLGIEQRTIKSGEFKTGDGLFDEDDNGEEDQIFIDLVESAHLQFKEIVSLERNLSLDELEDIADGRVFSGNQAIENGLVDGIGNLDDAVRDIENVLNVDALEVIKYYNNDFWGEILSIFENYHLESMIYNLAKMEEGTKIMYKMP